MAVDYDIVVIGGGSGGLVVASAAAQLKAKVALVEKDRLGGDCLWYGCVPSKSFLHAARVAHLVRQAGRVGVQAKALEIDFATAIGHGQKAIATIEPHDSPERFEGLGVEVISGEGRFLNEKTFFVNGRQLTARAFVIATGSRPAIPKVEGLQEAGFITNEQVFSLTEQPASLAVVGAGPIGCELGQGFHRLGTSVTLLTSGDRLLPKEDPEVAAVLEQQFTQEGIKILKNARLKRVEVLKGKKHLYTEDDSQVAAIASEILLATGRQPNVESLNLEAAGVDYDSQGICVNDKLQTTNSRIYACGDVIGGYQFTHVAAHEAVIVLQNALNPLQLFLKKVNYRVIPWATFTDPEVARVGMTEEQARKRYRDVMVLKLPFASVDRAQTEDCTVGFSKIIVRRNGEILGAHLVGAQAGELIHEIVLAMSYRLPVAALTGIHIYPTLSEINSKTALLLSKKKYADNVKLQNFLTQFFSVLRSF
ncbi:pyridine nucleotide-disulfide oxidoreductase [Synechococcus moorigangaii CMS01]|nr:pyridine nucleotide-disulfide oxidoreductase [Synechococcus moorigangaii CMS01]